MRCISDCSFNPFQGEPVKAAPAEFAANGTEKKQGQQGIVRTQLAGLELDGFAARTTPHPKDTRKPTRPSHGFYVHLEPPVMRRSLRNSQARSGSRAGIRIEPFKEATDACSGKGNAGIGCSVVNVDGVAIGGDGLAAREDDVMDVSDALVGSFRTEDPRVSALQADLRLVEVKKSEAQAIDAPRCRSRTPW